MGLLAGFVLGRWNAPAPGGSDAASVPNSAITGPAVPAASPRAGPARADAPGDLFGPCTVTHVVDGDTVDVACGASGTDRVRLLNIDTPERGEPGYHAASAALAERVAGERVWLAFETPNRPSRGRYGRLLAYLYVDGRNVNVEMVRAGWSDFYVKYGEGRFPDAFEAAEAAAIEETGGR